MTNAASTDKGNTLFSAIGGISHIYIFCNFKRLLIQKLTNHLQMVNPYFFTLHWHPSSLMIRPWNNDQLLPDLDNVSLFAVANLQSIAVLLHFKLFRAFLSQVLHSGKEHNLGKWDELAED